MICYIQARGGSKRFPGKNTALWNGVPMVVDAIRKARATGLFDVIAVTSDDLGILALASHEDAVPIWRGEATASDTATDDDVAAEIVRYFPKEAIFCKLYPCVPLLDPCDIRKAFFKMEKAHGPGIYSVDTTGKDAGAFYFFYRGDYQSRGTISLVRFPWMRYTLAVAQDINTPEDMETAKIKAGGYNG